MSVDNIGGTTVILGSSDIAALFGTPENTGGTATFAKVLGDALNSSIVARLTTLQSELSGTAGIVSFPAAAAPGNGVSIAEVLNHIAQQVARTTAAKSVASVTTANLFTVSGGPVRVLALVGYVTTGLEVAGNNMKIQFTPTGGAANDVCAVLDVTGVAERTWLRVSLHDVAEAVIAGTSGAGWVNSSQKGFEGAASMFFTGTFSMNCTATTTGAITWYIEYEPLAPGAAVTAA